MADCTKLFTSSGAHPIFHDWSFVMPLYAWVTPAFIPKGSPVDHTWVTSYDSRLHCYRSIAAVKGAGENYWFCWGSFHTRGRRADPIITWTSSSGAATCLVGPNNAKYRGTVHWYGIDGVCHQVSNQILYVTTTPAGGKPLIVSGARGYTLSSALFGTYGRRVAEWDDVRFACGVAPISIRGRRGMISLLSRRMANILNLPVSAPRVMRLEQSRRELLAELDDIGFALPALDETVARRVDRMNRKINLFLQLARQSFDDDNSFMRMFGIPGGEEIFLIDPELFVFPDPTDRPIRNSIVGW
jgi:hypothetical protein